MDREKNGPGARRAPGPVQLLCRIDRAGDERDSRIGSGVAGIRRRQLGRRGGMAAEVHELPDRSRCSDIEVEPRLVTAEAGVVARSRAALDDVAVDLCAYFGWRTLVIRGQVDVILREARGVVVIDVVS